MTQVTVVGAGLMGAGIGLGFARHGTPVCYLSRNPDAAARVVGQRREEQAALGLWESSRAGELSFVSDIDDLPTSTLVVESVPEDLALKTRLMAELSRAQPTALLCTNTSSLSITAVASRTTEPHRVAGMHFWYPPPLMPLVELVPGEWTSRHTLDRLAELMVQHGKHPIVLGRDIPGFVWNRLVVAVLREAQFLVHSGVVSARDVDVVVEQGLARRWSLTGPFASSVLGGVETFETVGRNLLPLLSTATALDGLGALLEGLVTDRAALDAWRNAHLAAQMMRAASPAEVAGIADTEPPPN